MEAMNLISLHRVIMNRLRAVLFKMVRWLSLLEDTKLTRLQALEGNERYHTSTRRSHPSKSQAHQQSSVLVRGSP